uniref:C-type lectin domain-containing protein n=2 Tax=Caenorhabditis japonica TaxID=281687 RepID=A0A8R1DMT2_CAEJA
MRIYDLSSNYKSNKLLPILHHSDMSSTKQLLILFLLGTILLNSVAGRLGSRRDDRRPTRQRDYEEDESESYEDYDPESYEEDDPDSYEEEDYEEKRAPRRRKVAYNDGGDDDSEEEDAYDNEGVLYPTDRALKRYHSWNNNKGACILQHKRCPAGNWRMFRRDNDTVCLKVFGSRTPINLNKASSICRTNHNARMMTLNSHQERKWLYTLPLVNNGSFPWLTLAGYRNRKCQMDPSECKNDKFTAFTQQDGTANPHYIYTRWGVAPLNAKTINGHLDNCVSLLTRHSLKDNENVIRDTPCDDMIRIFLCGVTVKDI